MLARVYRWVLNLSTLLVVACGSPESEITSGRFEALTYNVAGLPIGISKSEPEDFIPQISPLLNEYDLVLVQEDFSYHAELIRYIVHRYRSTPKKNTTALVNDGLNRFSRFPWTEFERKQWVQCFGDANVGSGDCLSEKGFSLARTEISPGLWVDIYNLHAEAGGGEMDIIAREAGIAQFIDYVLNTSAGNAVIIGGDTNLHLDDASDLILINDIISKLQVEDVCDFVGCGIESIDRFYFRSNDKIDLKPLSWRFAPEFVTTDGEDLSDHKPVHVSFQWHAQ